MYNIRSMYRHFKWNCPPVFAQWCTIVFKLNLLLLPYHYVKAFSLIYLGKNAFHLRIKNAQLKIRASHRLPKLLIKNLMSSKEKHSDKTNGSTVNGQLWRYRRYTVSSKQPIMLHNKIWHKPQSFFFFLFIYFCVRARYWVDSLCHTVAHSYMNTADKTELHNIFFMIT